MQGLEDWLSTPLGAYVLQKEQAYFDHAVRDIFGFHAVQYGFGSQDLLRENRMPKRWRVGMESAAEVCCTAEHLPFASQSIDLLLLPHVLDCSAHPHQVLREAERVLRPEGRVLISGFNPYSLWGMRRAFQRGRGQPWQANFLSLWRIKDWLALLGLEPCGGAFMCYAPPLLQSSHLARCQFMEDAGDRWWPAGAGIYGIEAVKRVHSLRLLKPAWRNVSSVRVAPAIKTRPASVCHQQDSDVQSE